MINTFFVSSTMLS